ncbi:MAG: DUF2177 family protein [Candidatus Aminicenantes bacterium]|nr:DUF2177 family protein [Candidatus Aminicenantes bacterium]
MNITKYVILYLIAVTVFLAVDMIWLGVIAKNLYRNNLKGLLRDKPNWAAAIIFYLLFIVGIIIFAVAPAIRNDSLITAVLYGGLFGFFTYATYDLTNYATLKNWPFNIVVIDILWGIVLTGIVSTVSYLASKKIF